MAFNAHPLHEWAKASGSPFQSELQRLLSRDLGVAWGRERNGCREMEGFSREQLRTFSKRTLQIEAELERRGEVYVTAADRMRADDQASLATRRPKDRHLTPALLRQAWEAEARTAGLDSPEQVERLVIERDPVLAELSQDDVFAALVDPDIGLCAKEARFGEAHVYERVCALSQGRWRLDEVRRLVDAFLASPHAVRLVPSHDSWRQGRSWSTAEHRALEDHVLYRLEQLAGRSDEGVGSSHLDAALGRAPSLGDDQADAVRTLCAPGPALRSLVAPAGFGKTTAIHAAAMAHTASGRRVLGLATTNKAVEQLRAVGLDAMTIARFRIETRDQALEPDALLIVDEVSQVSTRDAAVILDSAVATPGTRVWFLGDPRQTTPVAAGGIAAELARMGAKGLIPAPELTENRRQVEEADREALVKLREGKPAESQAIRTDHGWEHECESAAETREAMAAAVASDIAVLGPEAVVALAVSHADCEEMADRIRHHLMGAGRVATQGISGPGFRYEPRTYAAGDRVLLHAPFRSAGRRLHNGIVVTVVAASHEGLSVAIPAVGQRSSRCPS